MAYFAFDFWKCRHADISSDTLAKDSAISFTKRLKLSIGALTRRLLGLLVSTRVFFDYRLRRGQARYRHSERRGADIIHSQRVAELHTFRVSAMLAANSHFQLWPRFSSALRSPAHQHSDAFDIQRLKRVCAEHPGFLLVDVVGQEPSGIVARQPHGRLRQIIRA